MKDRKTASNWGDLEAIETTQVITLPEMSKRIGHDFNVEIRAIDPMELVKAFNFPMDQINQLVHGGAEADEFNGKFAEFVQTMDADQMIKSMESAIRICMVNPNPAEGNLRMLINDYGFIFSAITKLTMPEVAVQQAADFRPDGE